MFKSFGYAIATTSIGLMLAGGTAAASQWPASVVGKWKAVANLSPLLLDITAQGTAGACKAITGVVADTVAGGQKNPIHGFYCPESGRFSFLRENAQNKETFQVYSGNLSIAGDTVRMGGTFAEESLANALGEYNFQAQK